MKLYLLLVAMALIPALPMNSAAATRIVPASYSTPPCKLGKAKCPELNLQRVVSDDPWLTAMMDQILFPPCWSDFEDTGKKNCTLQQDVNAFAAQSAESVKIQSPPYSYSVVPSSLKDWGRLKQFFVQSNLYTGGAHGNPQSTFVILDPKARRQVKLANVVTAGQMGKLTSLLRERNKQRVVASEGPAEAADYLQSFPFQMTENFVFDRTGITFLYNVYELAPYAEGPIRYTIPYSQLKGILKPDYYPTRTYLQSLGK